MQDAGVEGYRRAIVEMRKRWHFHECRGVGGDGGVPCGAVVEVFGPGVVGAELDAAGEIVAEVDDEGVVVARAARPPRGGVGDGGVGLGRVRIIDGAVGEDRIRGLVQIAVEDLVVAVRAVITDRDGGRGGELLFDL